VECLWEIIEQNAIISDSGVDKFGSRTARRRRDIVFAE
jgi:hypothetical protein